MTTILPIQAKLLAFLKERIENWNMCPTQVEMATAIGVKTGAGALYHLKRLERAGYVQRGRKGTQRSLKLTGQPVMLAPYGTRVQRPGGRLVGMLATRLRTVHAQPGSDWNDVARAALGFMTRSGEL